MNRWDWLIGTPFVLIVIGFLSACIAYNLTDNQGVTAAYGVLAPLIAFWVQEQIRARHIRQLHFDEMDELLDRTLLFLRATITLEGEKPSIDVDLEETTNKIGKLMFVHSSSATLEAWNKVLQGGTDAEICIDLGRCLKSMRRDLGHRDWSMKAENLLLNAFPKRERNGLRKLMDDQQPLKRSVRG